MPASPSLLIVPARFKTGKLYTQIATTSAGLVLGSSGDFNVTRATTATRFNSAGLIESVASGIPRLDYYTSGGTAGCPALLVEPAATNFAPNVNLMNQFDTPTVSGGVALTTGSTDFLAPDGASGSINKYVGGIAVTQGTRYTGSGVGVNASGTYRFSLFVKAGTTNPLNFCAIQFALFTGASGTAASYFNLASGTALTSGSSIENYGNGWYRCISAPYTIAAGGLSGTVTFSLAEGNNDVTWPASGALDLTAYTWGAQMEAGSVATSYIPTTAAAVTRNAEVVTLSGAVSGCIGQTEGTIYCEFAYFGEPIIRSGPVYLRQANARGLSISAAPGEGIAFISRNDGGSTTITLVSGALQIGTYYKIAIGYNAGGTAAGGSQASGVVAYVNGVQTAIGTFRVPDAAGLTEFRMYGANAGTDAEAFNGRIRAAALYTTRLTNPELAALTT
jgi:hypothetical protein